MPEVSDEVVEQIHRDLGGVIPMGKGFFSDGKPYYPKGGSVRYMIRQVLESYERVKSRA